MKSLHNMPPTDDSGLALAKLFELAVVTFEFMERGLAERGLSRPRATVLWLLHERGPLRQRDLAEAIGVSARNVTGLVDGLERDGFAVRERHPDDRRAALVSLTGKGAATVAGLRGEYDEGAARLFADLGAGELAGFVSTVDRLVASIRAETC